MALTAAEKQKAYRARRKPTADVPDMVQSMAVASPTPVIPLPDVTTILNLVEDLYESRASNTTWRIELRRALMGL